MFRVECEFGISGMKNDNQMLGGFVGLDALMSLSDHSPDSAGGIAANALEAAATAALIHFLSNVFTRFEPIVLEDAHDVEDMHHIILKGLQDAAGLYVSEAYGTQEPVKPHEGPDWNAIFKDLVEGQRPPEGDAE
jgi:hypothetical protein